MIKTNPAGKSILPILFLLIAFVSTNKASGQNAASLSTSSDEQTIRNLVLQANEGKTTIKSAEDRVFVSGPFPKPFIGNGTPESQRITDSLRAARSNYVSKQNILRLEVAKSGDMAYEYGTGTLEFDQKDNTHFKGENSYLRVWKKVNGEWVVAAMFVRPNRP